MYLTRHDDSAEPGAEGARWAVDGRFLPPAFGLAALLQLPRAAMTEVLAIAARAGAQPASTNNPLLAPVEPGHEVWAAGVTYQRSREAREAESTVKDVYARVYEAARPELFFKATGDRVVGHGAPIRIRDDSRWNVPEPELTLVINADGEIVGYCAGNDVSSRDIEGENPLYLPQAKVYQGSCALGPGIVLCDAAAVRDLPIQVTVTRAGKAIFQGETRTSQMKRTVDELASYLCRELDFPRGVFLMTGTGIVPPQDFSMQRGDIVRIGVGAIILQNEVGAGPARSRPSMAVTGRAPATTPPTTRES